MVLYDTGHYHCYGCGAHGIWDKEKAALPEPEAYKEDIQESLKYVDSLPVQLHRGLSLPCDGRSVYIRFPLCDYYKARLLDGFDHRSKYRCPTGHPKPLFWAVKQNHGYLAIVEGELNALSLAQAYPWINICSPGSAGEFSCKRYLPEYLMYSHIYIWVDEDKAGLTAGMKLYSELRAKSVLFVGLYSLTTDFNDILITGGIKEIESIVRNKMGVS